MSDSEEAAAAAPRRADEKEKDKGKAKGRKKEKEEREEEAPEELPPSTYDLRVGQRERDETDRDLRSRIGPWGNAETNTTESTGARPRNVAADLGGFDSSAKPDELGHALAEVGAYERGRDEDRGAVGGYPRPQEL